MAVSAAAYHSLALLSDGTVVAWGADSSGQSTVPGELRDVIAITSGAAHSAALKRDGTVVVWGDSNSGLTDVPPAATNVIKLVSGDDHLLALRADGTVVAWGSNFQGATSVPPGLSNVVVIAAGRGFSLALIDATPGSTPLRLDNASLSAQGFRSEAVAERGRTHYLEYSERLNPGDWHIKPGISGTGRMTEFRDAAGPAQRFYRLRRE